jgi:hypothetical protein
MILEVQTIEQGSTINVLEVMLISKLICSYSFVLFLHI